MVDLENLQSAQNFWTSIGERIEARPEYDIPLGSGRDSRRELVLGIPIAQRKVGAMRGKIRKNICVNRRQEFTVARKASKGTGE